MKEFCKFYLAIKDQTKRQHCILNVVGMQNLEMSLKMIAPSKAVISNDPTISNQ